MKRHWCSHTGCHWRVLEAGELIELRSSLHCGQTQNQSYSFLTGNELSLLHGLKQTHHMMLLDANDSNCEWHTCEADSRGQNSFFCCCCWFVYLFMAVLGLRFCARAFCSCGKWGPLFIAVRGPLIIAASLVAEHRLQTRRLSNCGARAQLLRGMWDLPRPGLEPVSPALAGRFSTTAPPGKP